LAQQKISCWAKAQPTKSEASSYPISNLPSQASGALLTMKISIVTPSYQQGKFILRTLESVHQQRIDIALEHMVFDANSTDETIQILQQASREMPGLRWRSEADRGQAHAVNKGIQATDGDIIGWLNSDDVYYPNALQTVINTFRDNPSVDVIYGMADHIDTEGIPFESYPTEDWDPERLFQTCYICQPALFFRRSVVEKHGLLNQSLQYCMDYEYWIRLGKAGVTFLYLPQKLAGSRLYQETKTLSARVKAHKEINDMLKTYLGRVPEKWLFAYAHYVIEKKINRTAHPYTYRFLWLIHSLLATFRWNKYPSKQYMTTIVQHLTK
jgi:glycosyltransferase involved in cell wall biosynthesis